MSTDFNQVVLLGRCGSAPNIIRSEGKSSFAKVQIATNKKWKKDNTISTRTDWHTVIFNNKLAEIVEKYLRKGDLLLVKGELRSRKWQDKDGNNRYSVEVQAQELRLLTPKPKQELNTEQTPSEASLESEVAETDDDVENEFSDDIPF